MEPNNNSSQEIDLSYISKKTSAFFDHIGYAVYRFFKFCLKNFIIILALVIVGLALGYYLDNFREQTYKHEIIVVPNFNSTSYLYNSIENMDFEGTRVSKAEVEPIIDIYQFIQERYQNLEIAKYMSENNIQIDKFKEKSDVEKLYRYHLLTIYTKGEDVSGKIVDKLLSDLNNDNYFLERQKVEVASLQFLIEEIERSIASINNILNKLGNQGTTSSDLNIEMYSEINNLINSKKGSVDELNRLKVYQLEQSKVIYDSARVINIKNSSVPNMILLPIVLFLIFIVTSYGISLFKNYNYKTT